MKKLKYVGDGTLFVPMFGANADWYGDDDTEFQQRIETGLWAYDESDDYNKSQKSAEKKEAKTLAKEATVKVETEKEAVALPVTVEVVEVAPSDKK